MPPAQRLPVEVERELKRVVERWHQLPLDHALSRMPVVRALLEALAGAPEVPDLGPGVVMDQLTVLVWDARHDVDAHELAERLAEVRRQL